MLWMRLSRSFRLDPVLQIELAHPLLDVVGVVGRNLLEQSKVLRAKFFKGFWHSAFPQALLTKDRAATFEGGQPQRELEKQAPLMQREKTRLASGFPKLAT